jgi:hypothetical protein
MAGSKPVRAMVIRRPKRRESLQAPTHALAAIRVADHAAGIFDYQWTYPDQISPPVGHW